MVTDQASASLVGRTAELDRIRSVIGSAHRGQTAALLIEGEAGIGKTTLLAAAANLTPAMTVLRARGVESESTLDHAALLEVISPVRDLLAGLPSRQQEALAAALGWARATDVGDRYLVGAGTMMVLALAAEETPLLVVVDDLQWVDRESAQALLFVARRLKADSVALLFAARTGDTLPAAVDGIERLSLGGLLASDAAALLPREISADVIARLSAGTGGNPLAMLEVAATLTSAQRIGAAPLPEPFAVGPRLRDVYGRTLESLSPAAWQAVLLLATSRDEDAGLVTEALRAEGLDHAAAFAEAESRGVLDGDTGALRFRHPLLRAAAWRLASQAQRRAAHQTLAAVLSADGEDRLWHLSAAALGRDDVLANDVAVAAEAMRARRGFAAASAALERSAGLTTDAAVASARLAAAVEDAFLAGDLARTRTLGERLLAAATHPPARAAALFNLGLLEEFAGSVARAAALQREAADLGTGRLRARALAQLTMLHYRLDDPAGMLSAAASLVDVADSADPEQRMLAAYSLGAANVFGGDLTTGHALMYNAKELLEGDTTLREDPRHLLLALLVGRWLSDPEMIASYLDRRLERAREQGAFGVLVPALALVAAGRHVLGDHAGAYADAGEAIELGESLGYASEVAVAHIVLAFEADARGLHDEADRAMAEARRLVERAGTAEVAEHLWLGEALSAAVRGQPDRVVALLEPRIGGASPGRSGYWGDSLRVAPELVEAYVGVGQLTEATQLAEVYAAANPPPRAPQVEAQVARCFALVAPEPDTAVSWFEAALAADPRPLDPFWPARLRLLYGSRLRRAGRRIAAREQLRMARDAFIAMDLTAWANRAADELAATGETARPRRAGIGEPMTSQETRVARLVARGLTNREVATALFLSPKTVEHHLSSIFRKRGFRSRTELARSFAQDEASR